MLNPVPQVPWGSWDPEVASKRSASAPVGLGLKPASAHASHAAAAQKLKLPPPTFVSSEPWNEQRIGAVAISCSDGRYGDAVDDLCHNLLKIPAYDRLAVPGGPGWINEADSQRIGLCRTIREQLDFLVKSHELKRIVLITHFGCGFYGRRFRCGPELCVDKQLDDVRSAATILKRWFGTIETEGYLAVPRDGVMAFHRVE